MRARIVRDWRDTPVAPSSPACVSQKFDCEGVDELTAINLRYAYS
jgi:hypothetical protein